MRKLSLIFYIAVAFVLLSGCNAAPDFCADAEHVQEHSVLPYSDGVFVLTPYDFEVGWADESSISSRSATSPTECQILIRKSIPALGL